MTHPTPEYVRGLLEGTTPGPWTIRTLENFGFNVVHYNGGDRFDMVRVAKCGDEANAALIAAAPSIARAYVALAERVSEMERIGSDLIAQASDYYTARNGKLCSIEGDDGEKCWIVPFEPFEELRAALNLQSTREQETALSQQEGSKAS